MSRANSDLQNLMAAMDFGTLFLDRTLRIKRFTPKLADLFNITPGDVGRPITDFTHQLEYDGLRPTTWRRCSATSRRSNGRSAAAPARWYLVRMRPYRTVEDTIDGVVATFVDITERRAHGGRRCARASASFARRCGWSNSPARRSSSGISTTGCFSGTEAARSFTATRSEEAIGQVKERLLQTEVPGGHFSDVRQALLSAGRWSGELRHTTKDGRVITVESQVELIGGGDRRYVLESTRDVTEAKAWAARQGMLLSELSHRVKNTLAVVQAMVRQTWRYTQNPRDFLDRLDGRIIALADAHRLLVESEWAGADLRALVKGQLAALIEAAPGRVRLDGPAVALPPEIATPLGLILHELGTNAVKHGALSNDMGTIDLTWTWARGEHTSPLRVEWVERNGPPPAPTPGRGFGGALIRQGLPRAKVRHELEPTGARCEIEIDVPFHDPHGAIV